MTNEINISGQHYEQQEDGSWVYKADKSSILLQHENAKKKDGKLKAQYKDLPRYKLIPVYEDHFRKEFNKMLTGTTKEVLKYIKEKI